MAMEVRARSPEWFELAESANEFGTKLLLSLQPRAHDAREILAAVLFGRVLSAYQAMLILSERGMFADASTMRRSMLEALFVLGAIWREPTLVQTYIDNDKKRRLKVLRKMKQLSPEIRDAAGIRTNAEIDREIELFKPIADKVPELKTEDLAKSAGLHDLYLTEYTVLSAAAHHTVRDVERSLQLDDAGEISGLLYGPEDGSPAGLLFPAIDQLVKAAHVASDIFSIDIDVDRERISKRFNELPVPEPADAVPRARKPRG